jgi:hypothetical protein
MYKGTLDNLVATLYSTAAFYVIRNKRYVKMPFVSYKKMLGTIRLFSFTMRNVFNLATYEENRRFFATASKGNDYVVAGPNTIQLEINRVFGNAMN